MIEMAQLALLGGVLALDATSVGQFMLSRPVVAGALAGWLLGDPATGVTVGALLEMYLLVSFPTGGARFPEGPTATVAAVAAAVAAPGAGAIAGAVAFGLVWGQIGGYTITALRKANGRFVPEPGAGTPAAGTVAAAQTLAVTLDFLRGAAVTGLGVLLGPAVAGVVARSWPLGAGAATGLVMVGAAVSLGILLRDLGGFRARRALFVTGLALGLVGGRLL